MRHAAYEAGVLDGEEWVRDQLAVSDGLSLREGLNRPGSDAFESLIHGCGAEMAARVLGIALVAYKARGAKFRAAGAAYNEGWDDAIREAIQRQAMAS